MLKETGANLEHIVRLNTYYEYEGEGQALQDFWEAMTRVRMDYLAGPGPVGTAVRVNGLGYKDMLIEIEAIAYVGSRPNASRGVKEELT